ncbi:MAG: deoxyribodipyrimidine photo-lyase [Candidatus Aenigmarchaeota archaeon]|nr:deoxyribodipyrimidine photo-lyase [Candidatus Aenigmarchaeota archaeon]
MRQKRARILKDGKISKGPVIYWMSRDQRMNDNWALIHSQNLALKKNVPLVVVFCLVPEFLGANIRQYGFMTEGLKELGNNLKDKNIGFELLIGSPGKEIPKFMNESDAGVLITDFNPLKIKKNWENDVSNKIKVEFHQVDAHNIVPCWIASPKQEYAAYTFRPKINKKLSEFLDEFPKIKEYPHDRKDNGMDWKKALKSLKVDMKIQEVDWIKPGETEAKEVLRNFIENKLSSYSKDRNDPNKDSQSDLSPYLHFGQISSQRVALEIKKSKVNKDLKEEFLEELIVRKELSDNFCFYSPNYDSFDGFPDWAKKTLNEHRKDKREYNYSFEEFEKAKTHDDLWNAAQMEMVKKGKMHGYMRMYWAKKILEWTESPEKALEIAIHLNDKYELDGRDPNGYVGCAWSIGGVHDRAWKERKVFGKIRYMSYNGCKRKFNVEKYIKKWD